MTALRTMYLHEGRYAAEVAFEEIDDGSTFSPIVKKEDALKIDRIRRALRQGDVAAAAKEAKVFELLPLAGE